jgi:plastocyanin
MKQRLSLILVMSAVISVNAQAADVPEYRITIKDHKFEPAELKIPAGTKVKLIVKNENKAAAEFESNDFHREKIIPAGGEAKVFVGPLKPGEYKFFDEFHEATQGKLVVE